MIEIRPILQPEAEGFLGLLCDVFELDYARAYSIFFAEPLFDLNRKWALFDSGRLVSILTTVPLRFGWGDAVGIAGVATARGEHGKGYAGQLLAHVLEESHNRGESAVMLFAKDTRLYERLGFEVIDTVVRGPIRCAPEVVIPPNLDLEDVKLIYDGWSNSHPDRLRRDELRWHYWKWNLRVCTPVGDGYLCFEGGIVREVVVSRPVERLALPLETEWLGLSSMAPALGIQLQTAMVELSLMAYRVPGQPQFFMTDQF